MPLDLPSSLISLDLGPDAASLGRASAMQIGSGGSPLYDIVVDDAGNQVVDNSGNEVVP